MQRTFRFWTGDDSDATIVPDDEGFLFVGAEVDRNNSRAQETGQLLKLDPRNPDDPVVWSIDVNNGVDSGTWAAPIVLDDVVIWNTKPGKVYGVDRTTGEILWRLEVPLRCSARRRWSTACSSRPTATARCTRTTCRRLDAAHRAVVGDTRREHRVDTGRVAGPHLRRHPRPATCYCLGSPDVTRFLGHTTWTDHWKPTPATAAGRAGRLVRAARPAPAARHRHAHRHRARRRARHASSTRATCWSRRRSPSSASGEHAGVPRHAVGRRRGVRADDRRARAQRRLERGRGAGQRPRRQPRCRSSGPCDCCAASSARCWRGGRGCRAATRTPATTETSLMLAHRARPRAHATAPSRATPSRSPT